MELVKGLHTEIPDNAVGDFIVDVVHDPLRGSCQTDTEDDFFQYQQKGGKIYPSLIDNHIHAVTDIDWHQKLERHRDNSQKKRENYQRKIRTNAEKNSVHGRFFLFFFPGFICQLTFHTVLFFHVQSSPFRSA